MFYNFNQKLMFPDLQVIIISYNIFNYTSECVQSLIDSGFDQKQIIVVDNCSMDNSVELLKSNFPNVEFIENPGNYGYSKAVNIGLHRIKSKYVIISNSDVIYNQPSLKNNLVSIIENPDFAVIGNRQIYPN